MPYSILSSTKILTLAITPFLFILVVQSVCEFALVPGVYILLSPRKKTCTLLPEDTDVHIQQHNHQKDLSPCLSLYCFGKVIVELEKNTSKEFKCVYGACNLTIWHFEFLICF